MFPVNSVRGKSKNPEKSQSGIVARVMREAIPESMTTSRRRFAKHQEKGHRVQAMACGIKLAVSRSII
jgi:hypothetical protein